MLFLLGLLCCFNYVIDVHFTVYNFTPPNKLLDLHLYTDTDTPISTENFILLLVPAVFSYTCD